MLIEHNMRLVAHVVEEYQDSDYDMENLLSVGTIGLTKAMNTFNADKGSRLATCIARCVENEILMLLRTSRRYPKGVSFLEPIGIGRDGGTVDLVDVIEMDNRETLDAMVFEQDVKESYEAFESCLAETERMVLGMCYGLYRGRGHAQREVAGKLDISRPYVNRIEKKAIEKIRAEFARHG